MKKEYTKLIFVNCMIILTGLVVIPVNAQDVLKLGVVTALTGPAASWGTAQRAGVEFAADAYNSEGGIKVGDKKYKIEIISYDTQYKGPEAVSAYQRLVTHDKVKFIMGPLSSAGVLAVKPLVERDRIISIQGAYSSKAVDKNNKFMFRVYSTPVEFAGPMIRWIKNNVKLAGNKVAVINPNDETGWDSDKLLSTLYPKNGFSIVATEQYERTLKDFQPLLTRILNKQPDLIDMGTSAPATAGLVVRQAREMGYKGSFSKIGGPGPKQIVEAAGAAAEGVINYLMSDPASPEYKKLASIYQARYGHEMNEILVPFYDGTKILLAAIQKAGTINDTDKVRRAISEVMPFPSGLGGQISLGGLETYGSQTQFMTVNYVGIIKNGVAEVVGKAE